MKMSGKRGIGASVLIVLSVAFGLVGSALADVVVPTDYTAYFSSPSAGTVNGIAYADEDVVRYVAGNATPWALHFDGSAAGLPGAADIDAYDYRSPGFGSAFHYMSFDAPVNVPGLGTVDDSDVVLYSYLLLGGSNWSLIFDGSAYGLTTSAEDIDALSVSSAGDLTISTTGNFNVPATAGAVYTGTDDDQLFWNKANAAFQGLIPGSAYPIPPSNDLHNHAYENNNGETQGYLGLQRGGKFTGIPVGANDIIVSQGVSYFSSNALFWDASTSGFPKIDAFDLILP